MQNKDVMQGWEFAAKIAGAEYAASVGNEYVGAIVEAIEALEANINNHAYRGQDVAHFKGYVLEEYAAGTFNINAVAADSIDRAHVLHSNKLGSADIALDSGMEFSAKAYQTPEKSGIAQAVFSKERGEALYGVQGRLVPEDHLEGAKYETHKQALRNAEIRPDIAKANSETEALLTDRITNPEGIESNPIKQKQLEEIAKAGHNQSFSAEEHGLTLANIIKDKQLLEKSLEAGCTAAAITVAIQLAPEIYKAIDYLIKNREIDIAKVKTMGTKAISSGVEGFLRGSISCSLFIMCEQGVFGESLKSINPTLLGAVVSIVLETAKNSILVAVGKMSPKQMGMAFVDGVVISTGYMASMEVGKAIGLALGNALNMELPVVGYLVGTLLGCTLAVGYNFAKNKLIAFCVDSGFTCFGLVEQNYELPEEVLKELGIKTTQVNRADIRSASVRRANVGADVQRSKYETIDITILKRGIVGVNKVGYVV